MQRPRIEKLLAARMDTHAPAPVFDIDPQAKGEPDVAEPEGTMQGAPDDLATYLTDSMTWYIEFPHVDRSFRAVYATLPGYREPPLPEE